MQSVEQARQTHSIAKVSPCQVISPPEWGQFGARHERELGIAIELRVGLFLGWSGVCSGRRGQSEGLVPRSDARAGGAAKQRSVHVHGRRRRTCGDDRESEVRNGVRCVRGDARGALGLLSLRDALFFSFFPEVRRLSNGHKVFMKIFTHSCQDMLYCFRISSYFLHPIPSFSPCQKNSSSRMSKMSSGKPMNPNGKRGRFRIP
jgi:hypothetical protein